MPRSSTAQSSPAPMNTFWWAGSSLVSAWMRSNSFTASNRKGVPECAREVMPPIGDIAAVNIDEKVNAVEAGVRDDWGEQRVSHFQQENENKRQYKKRQKGHEIC